MKLKNCVLLIFMLYSVWGFSQNEPSYLGGVASVNYTGKISNKVHLNTVLLEAVPFKQINTPKNPRTSGFHFTSIEQHLGLNTNGKLYFGLGYSLNRSTIYSGLALRDNRLFIQGSFIDSNRNASIQHRLRLERRTVSAWADPASSLSHRLRYNLAFNTPISEKKYLTFNVEPFISLNKAPKRFNELWWYAGIGIKTRSNQRFEFGLQSINWRYFNTTWLKQYYFSIGWFRALKGDN